MYSIWYPHGLPWCLSSKESTCQCRRCGFDPWIGKIPCRKGNDSPLQYSYLENSIDRGTWRGHKESDTTERLNTHNDHPHGDIWHLVRHLSLEDSRKVWDAEVIGIDIDFKNHLKMGGDGKEAKSRSEP